MAAARAFYTSPRRMLILAGSSCDSKVEACRWLVEQGPRWMYSAPDGTERIGWPLELGPRIIHASVIRRVFTGQAIANEIDDFKHALRCALLVVDASEVNDETARCVSQLFKDRHEDLLDTVLLLSMDRRQFSETFSDSTQDCFRVDGIWSDCDGTDWTYGTALEVPGGSLRQSSTWFD